MIVGSDFDGVIADDTEARISYIKEKYGITVSPDEIHGTKLERKVGDVKKEIEIQVNCSERTLQFTPMPGVAEVFRKLVAEGDKIIIITGRTKAGIEWARLFMDQHRIPYHHIWSAKEFLLKPKREQERILAGIDVSLKGKGRLAGAIKPAVFVEDSDDHLVRLLPLKDTTKLFLLDRPYNRDFRAEGVERIYSWPEIYEKIQELKGGLVGAR